MATQDAGFRMKLTKFKDIFQQINPNEKNSVLLFLFQPDNEVVESAIAIQLITATIVFIKSISCVTILVC